MDTEKVVKELHDARRYLEDKEWSDRGASPHIDAINDALALLKEQEAVKIEVKKINNSGRCGRCPNCLIELNEMDYPNYCGFCGQVVKWE